MQELLASLATNPIFGAGFGLLGVGTGLALLRKGAVLGGNYLKRRYIVSIEIPHTDKSYYWFLNWMGHNVKKTQHLSLQTTFYRSDNGNVETKFDYVPSVGSHFFKYKGTWIHVERKREKQTMGQIGQMPEFVSLRMLGSNKEVFFELLEEAKDLAIKAEEGCTIIFTSFGPEWRPFGYPRRKRPLSSVILPDNIGPKILHDVRDFLSNSKWYIERGIPYRRGYLLYGPPGCGKSSFIQALAGELSFNICLLSLSERGLTDDRLNHLLTVAPEKSIILLEDVDACFASRVASDEEKAKTGYSNNVTFSGLLNALDGVGASEGRILFMTTNHLEKLDPALIRPGRVDVKIGLGNATREQVYKLFKNFYPNSTDEQAKVFSSIVPEGEYSMAELQGHFLMNKSDPSLAIKNFDKLREKHNNLVGKREDSS